MFANLCFIKFLLFLCLLIEIAECNSLRDFHLKNDFSRENLGQALIRGGRPTNRTETPWKVAIFEEKETKNKEYICGGSLISDDLILTAAHCVHEKEHETPKDPSKFEIILGAHNLTNSIEFGRINAKLQEIIVHENWDAAAISYNDDIALLRLNEKVDFTRFIQPIALMNTTELKEFGKVSGWGAIDDKGKTADVARIAELKTTEVAECVEKNRKLSLIFWAKAFCAKNEDQGVCVGDSGSGFYFDIDGKIYLKGLVSSRIFSACSKNEVALYTDITKYFNFIQEYFNYVKNVLKIDCKYDYFQYYKCSTKFDEFNFDLPVTEIQLYHEDSRNSATEIESINFGQNMKKFPKFQKQLFKTSLPKSNGIEMNLKDDIELAKQLPSFLKKFDWIRKFEFDNLLIDEDSLNIFDEAKQMEELTLWNCKFPNDHLPERLFSKLTSLTYLYVGSYDDETKRIKTLDENVFLPLTNLVTLSLGENRIKTLPENLFQSLRKLEKLFLYRNEIEILPRNLFRNNQNLQTLTLHTNKLKEIRVDFRTLPNISLLELRYNDCINEIFFETSKIHEKAEYIMNKCKRT